MSKRIEILTDDAGNKLTYVDGILVNKVFADYDDYTDADEQEVRQQTELGIPITPLRHGILR